MPYTIQEFQSTKQLFEYVLSAFSDLQYSRTSQDPRITVGLSGGNTPRKLYELMSKNLGLSYKKFQLFQVDERFVPSSNSDSNQKIIVEAFGHNQELQNSFVPFDVGLDNEFNIESQDGDMEVASTISILLQKYNQILPETGLDICFLGFGTDGHFASIFPSIQLEFEQVLNSKSKAIHTISHPPYPVPNRFTLSPKYILSSGKIIVILIGKDKKAILEEFQNNSKPCNEFPANFLHNSENLQFLVCWK
jgi:6-phosphogluconolactonase